MNSCWGIYRVVVWMKCYFLTFFSLFLDVVPSHECSIYRNQNVIVRKNWMQYLRYIFTLWIKTNYSVSVNRHSSLLLIFISCFGVFVMSSLCYDFDKCCQWTLPRLYCCPVYCTVHSSTCHTLLILDLIQDWTI